ncbi:MAG: hypothetical protein LBL74_08035 [Bacteroidales bacterium]|jgi:hypothetical protein|nr:hypothetical protein [Bacteroidales bacterium]
MKKTYLFPTCFQMIGWLITLPSLALVFLPDMLGIDLNFDFKMPALLYGAVLNENAGGWFVMADTSFATTILPVLLIVGLCFIAFAKRRYEDEYVSKIREQSLVWSILTGCAVFVLLTLFVYGMSYLLVLYFITALFLIIFVCKFNYELYKLKKANRNEE